MSHNAYYQQPQQPQQSQGFAYYQQPQQPQNIYQQLGQPQPQPHLQRIAAYQPPAQAQGYQQYPHQQPPPQQLNQGYGAPPYGHHSYSAPTPQPPSVNQYPSRPQSTYIPTASYDATNQGYIEQIQQPIQHPIQQNVQQSIQQHVQQPIQQPIRQPIQPQSFQQPQQPPAPIQTYQPPQQIHQALNLPSTGAPISQSTISPQQLPQTGVPLSGSRPPLSQSALLAQQVRVQQIQAAAAAARNSVPPTPQSSFVPSNTGSSLNQVPQTPSKRPLPKPGNASVKPPTGLPSGSTGRPISMPPQLNTSSSTGGTSPSKTLQSRPQSQLLSSSATSGEASPTKSRPLPGTPAKLDTGGLSKRMTVDLGRISGLPVTSSTFGGNIQLGERSRPPSPIKLQNPSDGSQGPPQLPALGFEPSSHASGSLSRTTTMATGNFNRSDGSARSQGQENLPKRRASPPRFSSPSNSPVKEQPDSRFSGSHGTTLREESPNKVFSNNPPTTRHSQGNALNDMQAAKMNALQTITDTSPATTTMSSGSSSASSPTKKFTPMWKRTIPDYPAPVFGYASGMVAEPFTKPNASSNPTTAGSSTKVAGTSVSPHATPTGKGKAVDATTPKGKITIRGIPNTEKDGSPSMLPYLHPTPPGAKNQSHTQGRLAQSQHQQSKQQQSHGYSQAHSMQQNPQVAQVKGHRQQVQQEETTEEEETGEEEEDEEEDEYMDAAYEYEGSDASSESGQQQYRQRRGPDPKVLKARSQREEPSSSSRMSAMQHASYVEQPQRRKGSNLRDRYTGEREEQDEEEDEEDDGDDIYEERRPRSKRRATNYDYDQDDDYDDTPTKFKAPSSSQTRAVLSKVKGGKLVKSNPIKMRLRTGETPSPPRSAPAASSRARHRSRGSESDGFVVVDASPTKARVRGRSVARSEDDWEQLQLREEWENQKQKEAQKERARSRGHSKRRAYVDEEEEDEDGDIYEEEPERKGVNIKAKRKVSLHRRERATAQMYEDENGGDAREHDRGRGSGHRRERSERYDDQYQQQQQMPVQQRRGQSEHRRMASNYQDAEESDSAAKDHYTSRGSPVKFGGGSGSPIKSSSPTKASGYAVGGHPTIKMVQNLDDHRNMPYNYPSSPTKEGLKDGHDNGYNRPTPNPPPPQYEKGGYQQQPSDVKQRWMGRQHVRDASMDSSTSHRSTASSSASVVARSLSEFPPPPTHPSSPRPYLRLGLKSKKSYHSDDQASSAGAESEDGDGYSQQQGSRLPNPPDASTSPRKLVKGRPVPSLPPSPTKGQGYGYQAHQNQPEYLQSRKNEGVKALASKFNNVTNTGNGYQQQQQQQPPTSARAREGSPRKLPPTPNSAGGQSQGGWPKSAPPQRAPIYEHAGHNGYVGGHASAPSPAPSSSSSISSSSSVKPPLPPRPNPSPALTRFGKNIAGDGQQNPQQIFPSNSNTLTMHKNTSSGNLHHRGMQQPTGNGGQVRGEVARDRVKLKGGYDALDEPPPRSLRTPSPAPSAGSASTSVSHFAANHYTGQQQQQQQQQHRRGQSMYAQSSPQPQPQPRSRPQSQVYGNSNNAYGASSGSFSPASDLAISVAPEIPGVLNRHTPLPEFRKQQDIQCPAPVGGRDKTANIFKMEEEETQMDMNQRNQQPQKVRTAARRQLPNPTGGGHGSIPKINFDFGHSNGQSSSSPNVPSIQIMVEDGPPSKPNNHNIPTISFDSFGGPQVPTINEPQNTGVPKVNIFEVPGVSVSGPEFEDNPKPRSRGAPPPPQQQQHSRGPSRTQGRTGGLICAGCEGPIIGRIVAAMGVRWHPQCFKCTVCQELLEHVSSYEHDGRPYCHLDYHENFAPKCYSCKTAIIEEQFISLDDPALGKRTYHMEHFFCAECGDPFMTPSMARAAKGGELALSGDGDFEGFTVYKGHPYCEPCHVRLRLPKCKKCKNSIRDHERAVEALGGKWCWSCFVCQGCHTPFEDPSFYERDKNPYCESCFTIILRNEV
ncbi:hypothetical protein FA15DRAFT_615514 [Coprinopsis marcescibilis]|uniref:LIM zinc-binding domain-containing protein n=1 Tax=Coprinopsis marcescibilis TaxID=230819 RepID=A0A5C3L1J3_COPMA|nr:hypothetical protein FA15DRAFT_615514 [Coprinopsis marcescibilis]